jgi:hypothetical protein
VTATGAYEIGDSAYEIDSSRKPATSTHVVRRTVTSTITTLPQLRQRTTVPGARR